jgi:addiction module HigA family antidote
MIERYTAYWVDLDPTRGSELNKHRPAVVISDDEMNASLGTVVVCPLTTRLHPRWPSRIRTEVAGQIAELAKELGVSRQSVNELVRERRAVSPEMALRLSRFFGNSAEFWLNGQREVDLWDAARKVSKDLERISPVRTS